MKLVLDTNIYISAFLWGGKPKEILERAIEGKDEVFISRAIKDEIFEVLKRPRFKVNETAIEALIREIEDISELVIVTERIERLCRDIDDNAIIECAVGAEAEYLITGDNDLLVLKSYRKIKIVNISEYLRIIEEI